MELIYDLNHQGEFVYEGISDDMGRRLPQQKADSSKALDCYKVVKEYKNSSFGLMAYNSLIAEHKPKYNKQMYSQELNA